MGEKIDLKEIAKKLEGRELFPEANQRARESLQNAKFSEEALKKINKMKTNKN